MSDLNSYKKADLVNVCKKLDIPTLAKDTKKVLTEKVESYISEYGEDGVLAVQGILQDKEDEDEETLAEEEEETEEEKEDNDYEDSAPINLKEWIIDPIIEKSEAALTKVYEFTDKVGITTVDFNDELRDQLSKSITLNYLEISFEFLYFLYTYIPLVALSENPLVHQVLKDNIEFFDKSDIPTPNLLSLVNYNTISTFFTWALTSIFVPLVVSYYVNFSKRVIVLDEEAGIIARIYRYDPFIFALVKVLIFYFVTKNYDSLTTLNSYRGIFNALKHHILLQLGVYGKFTETLGNFPLIIGVSNILVAIYSQFEDY
ncbi:uncharacterized protein PRCAT00002808001 [Priceomyces carsonii]|uniref:uncharacterized protein n=1 Tax=Priceomyces carsonii TaxID=28549 RepID=UPI002ED89528|nr:unnamed protein product [Priceomyces carsonii]